MMAFAEELAGRTWIIRSGPYAVRYGDPFDYAVAVTESPEARGIGIVKALVATDRAFSQAHAKSIIATVKALGLKPEWERFK